MVRVPSWVHKQDNNRDWDKRLFRPGWRGTGMQPPRRPPISAYTKSVQGVPLAGGQAQTTIGSNGTGMVAIGPQALGTVWYPQAATISTTTGITDSSTANIFLGATNVNNLLVGASQQAGADTVGLSVPAITPGGLLIAVWTGGHHGDLATINIIGTMDALSA